MVLRAMVVTGGEGKPFGFPVEADLSDKQFAVDGFIEYVHHAVGKRIAVRHNQVMRWGTIVNLIVNEEGMLRKLPYNAVVSQAVGTHIMGNAIVFYEVSDESEEVDEATWLRDAAAWLNDHPWRSDALPKYRVAKYGGDDQ